MGTGTQGTQIFRVAKLSAGGVRAMAQHALRERALANATPGGQIKHVAGLPTSKDVMTRLAALQSSARAAGQRLRENNVAGLDLLFTCSSRSSLTHDSHQRYLKACLDAVQTRWPHAEILTAAFHDDETTPHLQIILAPLDEKGHFNAKSLLGSPRQISQLQDYFHENAGKKYGLKRGEKGSSAVHIPPKQFYEAAAQAGAAEPTFVDVPPAPTAVDKINGTYQEKKQARENAIEHNKLSRQHFASQAKLGRSLHPEMLRREAEKYRRIKAEREKAAADLEEAKSLQKLAKIDLEDAKKQFNQIKAERAELELQKAEFEAAVLHTQTTSYVGAWDAQSKLCSPSYIAKLANELRIDLKPGRGLVDQVRRGLAIKGQGAGLEAIKRADEAADMAGIQPIGEALASQQWQQQVNG